MKLETNLSYVNKSINDDHMVDFKGDYNSLTRAVSHLYIWHLAQHIAFIESIFNNQMIS